MLNIALQFKQLAEGKLSTWSVEQFRNNLYCYKNTGYIQGLKKVLSGCPGQVDFPARQQPFNSHLLDEQGCRQVVI